MAGAAPKNSKKIQTAPEAAQETDPNASHDGAASEPVESTPPAPPVDTPVNRDEESEYPSTRELFGKPHIQEWVRKHHKDAANVLRNGPGGHGWRHNETKRQEAEEMKAFLDLLLEAVTAAGEGA